MSDETPLVSVVIPAYNHAVYLEETIDSVLAQDYPRVEVIVLDDGSTDGTSEVLKQYTGRLYWESQSNVGQAATLNKGWQMARGEILSYLSADDVLARTAASTAVQYLTANPQTVLTYCDFELIDPESRPIRLVHAPDYDYRNMVLNFQCAPGPGVFFRRSTFLRAGLWNETLKQNVDYEYWLRLGLYGEFTHIPQLLAKFRVHEGSQTFSAPNESRAEEPVRIITEYYRNQPVPVTLRHERPLALSSAHLVTAQLHLRAGRYRAAFLHMREAWLLSPRSVATARAVRIVTNGVLNRAIHRSLWGLRRLTGRRGR